MGLNKNSHNSQNALIPPQNPPAESLVSIQKHYSGGLKLTYYYYSL